MRRTQCPDGIQEDIGELDHSDPCEAMLSSLLVRSVLAHGLADILSVAMVSVWQWIPCAMGR